jgi:hypothetical protein
MFGDSFKEIFDGKIDSTKVTKQNVERSILSVIPELLQAGVSAIVVNLINKKMYFKDDLHKHHSNRILIWFKYILLSCLFFT